MSNFLFCFLRESKRAPAINQWRHILVCQKLGCGYLNLEEETPTCVCEPNTEYIFAFQDRNKKKHKEETETTFGLGGESSEEETDNDSLPGM